MLSELAGLPVSSMFHKESMPTMCVAITPFTSIGKVNVNGLYNRWVHVHVATCNKLYMQLLVLHLHLKKDNYKELMKASESFDALIMYIPQINPNITLASKLATLKKVYQPLNKRPFQMSEWPSGNGQHGHQEYLSLLKNKCVLVFGKQHWHTGLALLLLKYQQINL